jgi:uncharacterized membrane protein
MKGKGNSVYIWVGVALLALGRGLSWQSDEGSTLQTVSLVLTGLGILVMVGGFVLSRVRGREPADEQA